MLAIDVYIHRLVGGIGAMSAATGGVDALVFTGGVGEQHSATVRRRAVERLGFLGVTIDIDRNDTVHDDSNITAAPATVQTLVITAREDLQIAARRASSSAPERHIDYHPDIADVPVPASRWRWCLHRASSRSQVPSVANPRWRFRTVFEPVTRRRPTPRRGTHRRGHHRDPATTLRPLRHQVADSVSTCSTAGSSSNGRRVCSPSATG